MFKIYTFTSGRKHYYPAENGKAWQGTREAAEKIYWHLTKQLEVWHLEEQE